MISDKEMCDFLYSMLVQLEIDWATIATQHGISNAHAARMRWHRFHKSKNGNATKPRTTKKPPKEGLEKAGDKSSRRPCTTSSVELCRKRDIWAGDDVEDGDDEEVLNQSHKRVKLEHNDDTGASGGMLKQEDLDSTLGQQLYAWNSSNEPQMTFPPSFSMPMPMPMAPHAFNAYAHPFVPPTHATASSQPVSFHTVDPTLGHEQVDQAGHTLL